MLKKALPLFLMSGLVLGGCYNNGAMPSDNETPMENVEDRTRDWTPNVRDERRGGMDLDGFDNDRNQTGDGVRDGIINDDGVRDGIINDNNGVRNGVINDRNETGEVIDDQNRTDRNNR